MEPFIGALARRIHVAQLLVEIVDLEAQSLQFAFTPFELAFLFPQLVFPLRGLRAQTLFEILERGVARLQRFGLFSKLLAEHAVRRLRARPDRASPSAGIGLQGHQLGFADLEHPLLFAQLTEKNLDLIDARFEILHRRVARLAIGLALPHLLLQRALGLVLGALQFLQTFAYQLGFAVAEKIEGENRDQQSEHADADVNQRIRAGTVAKQIFLRRGQEHVDVIRQCPTHVAGVDAAVPHVESHHRSQR